MNKRTYNTSAQKSFRTCLHLNFSAPPLFCHFLVYGGYQSWVKFQRCIKLASWFSSALAFWTGAWAELSSCCVARGSSELKVPLPQPEDWECGTAPGFALSARAYQVHIENSVYCEDSSTVLFFQGPNLPTQCSLAGNYRLNQGLISY